MTGQARYAIYYAPAPDTPAWAFGSAVLGYDAATGDEITGFAPPGWEPEAWRRLTGRPRTYGFHATLKAPFALADGTEAELQQALDQFVLRRRPVPLGPLAVTAIAEPGSPHGFVALTPRAATPEIAALERDIVIGFDRFRQPLSDAERQRRDPERLSERQRRQLDAHGYPFVLDDFRFHMTLTGGAQDAPDIADCLAEALAARVGTVDLTIDALCLFRQAPGERFQIIGRYAFAASTQAPGLARAAVPVVASGPNQGAPQAEQAAG